MKASERLLSVKEAEDRTGRKASTWRRDILERRVPYVKIGRSVRIPVEVIDKLIADGWRDAVPLNGVNEGTRER
jgi:excisionase family DNA binding protein